MLRSATTPQLSLLPRSRPHLVAPHPQRQLPSCTVRSASLFGCRYGEAGGVHGLSPKTTPMPSLPSLRHHPSSPPGPPRPPPPRAPPPPRPPPHGPAAAPAGVGSTQRARKYRYTTLPVRRSIGHLSNCFSAPETPSLYADHTHRTPRARNYPAINMPPNPLLLRGRHARHGAPHLRWCA